MDESGCVSVKVYLGALQVEFHRMFTSQNIIFLLIFFSHLKIQKTFLTHRLYSNRQWPRLGLACDVKFADQLLAYLVLTHGRKLRFPVITQFAEVFMTDSKT